MNACIAVRSANCAKKVALSTAGIIAHRLAMRRAVSPHRRPPANLDAAGDRDEERAMQGVVFLGDRKLELRDFPDPTPGPREVVLEIKASGMCGSDLHTYRAPFAPGEVT